MEQQVLVMPRRKNAASLVFCLVFLALGIFALTSHLWFVGIFLTVVFVPCALAIGALVVTPSVMVLSEAGFTITFPPRKKPFFYRWNECGPFWPRRYSRRDYICFSTNRTDHKVARGLNRMTLGGSDVALPAGHGGYDAAAQARLMEEYRFDVIGASIDDH